ncbi:MAG TPA: ABC transporter ATP-binding protein [Nitrososphaera sp.]
MSIYQLMSSEYVLMNKEVDWKRVHSSYQHEAETDENVAMHVKRIYKIYDSAAGRVVALRDVTFKVNKGEFLAIVGPSGSGKSTLLNMIGALDRPTSGRVFVGGVDIFSLSDSEIATIRNKMIGFVFQSYNLINRTTVQRNVELPAIIDGMGSSIRVQRARKLLELLGIGDKAKFKPSNLSGGQQQRVAIARSLMNNPTIILADEPTGNLDTKTGNEVFNLLRNLSQKYRRTVVMVTHNPALAEATDRAIYIKDGTVEKEVLNK